MTTVSYPGRYKAETDSDVREHLPVRHAAGVCLRPCLKRRHDYPEGFDAYRKVPAEEALSRCPTSSATPLPAFVWARRQGGGLSPTIVVLRTWLAPPTRFRSLLPNFLTARRSSSPAAARRRCLRSVSGQDPALLLRRIERRALLQGVHEQGDSVILEVIRHSHLVQVFGKLLRRALQVVRSEFGRDLALRLGCAGLVLGHGADGMEDSLCREEILAPREVVMKEIPVLGDAPLAASMDRYS